jgi:hypothetical protein
MPSVASQVDKADRTEVEVVTHCDELQVNKANRKEVDIVSYIAETAIFLLMNRIW